jgi:hypothetical protein
VGIARRRKHRPGWTPLKKDVLLRCNQCEVAGLLLSLAAFCEVCTLRLACTSGEEMWYGQWTCSYWKFNGNGSQSNMNLRLTYARKILMI